MCGSRFAFGANWRRFLSVVDAERIEAAQQALTRMLGAGALARRSFLDVGCGSGLFSLAAFKVGARRVHSFDCDDESVACARELRRRYVPSAASWTIERGDVLDVDFLRGLGKWDVVYAWGVLHHSGDMWRAVDHVAGLVEAGGVLFVSLYNDQGARSRAWRAVKRLYNRGRVGKTLVLATFVPWFVGRGVVADLVRARSPMSRYARYKRGRGMSMLHDVVDWLGGYPFEVARPDHVVEFCGQRGLRLERLDGVGRGLGCNEFVFRKR